MWQPTSEQALVTAILKLDAVPASWQLLFQGGGTCTEDSNERHNECFLSSTGVG